MSLPAEHLRAARAAPKPAVHAGLPQRFGREVRQLRKRQRWSQEQLAGQADLNRSYLGEIERGSVVPSLATAAKLATALAVSLSVLIERCEQAPDGAAAARRAA